MKSVMVDIETLSTHSDAFVWSIGLAAFDDERVIDTMLIKLNPETSDGHIDPATIRWWLQQSDAARAEASSGTASPFQAYADLMMFWQTHQPQEVWANSPSFDLVILENAIRRWAEDPRKGMRHAKAPWEYWQQRDFRTLAALAKEYEIPYKTEVTSAGTAHSAVEDAALQARQVIFIRKWLPVYLKQAISDPADAHKLAVGDVR